MSCIAQCCSRNLCILLLWFFCYFFLFFKCLPCAPLPSHLALFSLTRLKVPPPQDYMAHHRGAYDKYSAGLSDKYNDKYSEGLAAKYNDKYAPRSSSSLMPASTDSMVGFMAKYKWVEIRNCKRIQMNWRGSIYYSLAKRTGPTCWNIDLSRKFPSQFY